MAASSDENQRRVVKFVQELLLDDQDKSIISPAIISQQIDLVLKMKPSWGEGLDRDEVADELIRRFSIWIGKDSTLKNEQGHVAWLNSARKKGWPYWKRYREWMEEKLSVNAVDALDHSTDSILGLLEDPLRDDCWDRRGLVVGHVQSGKTGSYTGLICKAADAGYKIIIVLAGMHNNLRSQTQIRLDEGFLGYATSPNPEHPEFIGVGKNGLDASIRPNCATNRTDKGDFSKKVANQLAISPEERPWLFVVKKNKSVLTLLLNWIRNRASDSTDKETGRKIVTKLPLLMIDDEADHASVDTGEQLFDEEGLPDEEFEPKAINSLIRKILHSFTRAAYVGYTATPFANIFIHEKGATRDEGPDLFPEAFIYNLAAPSNYIGPSKVFGLSSHAGRQGGLPLIREIQDQNEGDSLNPWMPPKHKNGHFPRHNGRDELPPSLVEALDSFLLACAIRNTRGQRQQHSSMLVHVTRFNSTQTEVFQQIDDHIRNIRQRIHRQIDHEGILQRLNKLWVSDMVPTTADMRSHGVGDTGTGTPSWEEIVEELKEVLADIQVRMINGEAKDVLDYSEYEKKGLKIIAIGGDKLARGLTLEGLCTSYFLRASKMYDTLMQMGRWFGYRPDYLDLCRLYTTADLIEWFGHIADAAEELRGEFDLMEKSGLTPKQYGLKVQSHPVLMVTSPLKMRTAKNLMLSFSGQVVETVALHMDLTELSRNLDAFRHLLQTCGDLTNRAEIKERRNEKELRSEIDPFLGGFVVPEVPASDIVDFLNAYRTHPAAFRVNSLMLAEFVTSMSARGELTEWTVAVMGTKDGTAFELLPGVKIGMNKRSGNDGIEDRYSIGRLLDPKDEAIGLTQEEYDAAVRATKASWKSDPGRLQDSKEPVIPSGRHIRRIRGLGSEGVPAHPERGLLIVYLLDPQKTHSTDSPARKNRFPEGTPPVVAIGIAFPDSESGQKVEYKVTNLLWETEYGSAD